MGALALLYGGACYALAMATILYAICFIGGFGPLSLDGGGASSAPFAAVVIDLLLLGVFAIQHSVMARPVFKAWWTRMISPAIERSTYVLASVSRCCCCTGNGGRSTASPGTCTNRSWPGH